MADAPELTDAQTEIIPHLPGTSSQVAEAADISQSAFRRRRHRINERYEEAGLATPIYRDGDGLYVWDGEKDRHRMKTHHTGSITRAANNFLTDDEAGIKALLDNAEPATATQDPEPSHEDLVVHLTDLHYGDKVTDERGRVTFNTEIADRRVNAIVEEALRVKREQDTIREFDTCHLCLGGDAVTGTGIYDGQWADLDHEVGATLKHQINHAAETLMSAIKTLASEFETLQVVCVPGNHGELRASGVSKQANADIHTYSRLDFGVRHSEMDNVHFVFNDSTSYTNFEMRGGAMRGHMRHGEGCQPHAGATSASKRDWRGWLLSHEFDVSLRGHYHEAKLERVHGRPVIMGGSIKPPGDFEESISEWSGPAAVVFGVSDEQAPTFTEWLEF